MKRQGHDLLLEQLNRDSLYLPGPPGAGKSTFCNWVCQVVASHAIPSDTHEVADEYQESLPDNLLGRPPHPLSSARVRGAYGLSQRQW